MTHGAAFSGPAVAVNPPFLSKAYERYGLSIATRCVALDRAVLAIEWAKRAVIDRAYRKSGRELFRCAKPQIPFGDSSAYISRFVRWTRFGESSARFPTDFLSSFRSKSDRSMTCQRWGREVERGEACCPA